MTPQEAIDIYYPNIGENPEVFHRPAVSGNYEEVREFNLKSGTVCEDLLKIGDTEHAEQELCGLLAREKEIVKTFPEARLFYRNTVWAPHTEPEEHLGRFVTRLWAWFPTPVRVDEEMS